MASGSSSSVCKRKPQGSERFLWSVRGGPSSFSGLTVYTGKSPIRLMTI